jgi:NADH dehydrogenase (ubiquinone) Fe-S protein 2
MSSELVFCLAVEKLFNILLPVRAKFVWTMFAELARFMNHVIAVTSHILDAETLKLVFWVFKKEARRY